MEQPGGQPLPGGFAYSSGPPSGAQPPRPGGMMLPNGQPPRPSPLMPMQQQQRPPFPAQMASPQPPMNGMPSNPPISNQPRPPNQQFPPQGFAPQYGPLPPKLNGPQNNFPQQIPPTGVFQQYGPPSQLNGLQPSGPQSLGQYPAHMQQQQFSRPPFPPSGSFPQMSAQGPPPRGPLAPHNVGPAGDAHTPPRGSPLPPHTGIATPRGSGPGFNSPHPSMPYQQQQQQQPPSMPPLPHPHPIGQPPSLPTLTHPPPMGQPPSMSTLPHPPLGGQSPYMSPQPHPVQSPPHMPPPMHPPQEHPSVHLPPQQQHPGMPPLPSQVPQPRRPPPIQDQSSHMSKRYPAQTGYSQPTNNSMDGLSSQMGSMSVTQSGFNKLWGMDSYDLMQMRNILPPEKVEPPKISLHQTLMESANCSPDIFRCTLTKIPETSSLLQKSRLPLGILIHPFKDLSQLPVIQCNTIVRCRACRTYINPFVYFVDHRRWKCNLCFRVNELPEEFQYDPVSKTYGDPSRRPEIKSATIEFIAPSEYMLRPPQPAVYLFVLEVSRAAAESGYLRVVCETLIEELERLPGDARTQIGFLTFDSALHFYGLGEGLSQPHMMVVGDIDDVFLPCPDNLLVNLHESRELVKDLLTQLPSKFVGSVETGSALGPALQASFKLMAATGGRVTVFQVSLPSCGPGSLQTRGIGGAKDSSPLLNPATDFYKRLALDCSGQQIAVDLFLLNSQYADLASLSGISRYSGGCIYHFPDFSGSRPLHTESLERSFRRYLTRKIGFEAVMRVRCTRGLGIHTFHGNFFVRSTDLLSLPNVNPDAGFGMQVSIEENLSDVQNVCFQAALLYTSSKGERRIRVHTLCLPIAANVADILTSADQQCIVGLLAKMAVDRSQMSSLSDARDAFINVAVDVLSIYRTTQTIGGSSSGLLAPHCLRLLPLFIVALLKHAAFRSGQSVRVDDRLFAMCQMKSLPLVALMQSIYPDLYPVHFLTDEGALEVEGRLVPQPPRVHLSAEKLDSRGLFLLDTGERLLMYAGRNIAPELCQAVLGVPAFEAIPDDMMELPELESPESQRLRNFVTYLQTEKPFPPTLQVIREDSKHRGQFIQYLLEDRSESALSYYEFLQHLKSQVK